MVVRLLFKFNFTLFIIISFAVLRLGKSFEMLYAAKDAMYIKDFILQTCLTLARISSACFLFLDHILWLHRVKAIHIDIKPISKICNQFWLLSMVINLMRNAYDWHRIYQHHNQQRMRTTEVYVPETLPTLMDTVRNTFDILVPMNGLQYAHVPGVVQGATGVVSSLISIMVIWNDKYKLPNK